MTISDERFDALMQTVRENIEKYGWHATGVFPTPQDVKEGNTTSFTYTAGLLRLGHPELILFSMDHRRAHAILTGAVDLVQAGESLPVNERVGKIIRHGFDPVFVPVEEDAALAHLTIAHKVWREELIQAGFRALQLVWPDANNLLPWHEGYTGPDQYLLHPAGFEPLG
jgi:hypothetical protein